MKVQILTDKNLVAINDENINIDCARFKSDFIFCEINSITRWIEKEPFKGREKLKDWSKVESFIDEAKVILNKKANKPNTYSIWDETTQDWIKDETLKKEFENKEKLQEINSLKEYLKDTDFYYVRLAETGEVVPANVVEKRLETRAKIRELEDN